jgi:hypothetical protein
MLVLRSVAPRFALFAQQGNAVDRQGQKSHRIDIFMLSVQEPDR